MNIDEIKRSLGDSYAKKSLGQHFLTNEQIVKNMVAASDIHEQDSILEVGPGLGILTKEILNSPAREIILCEKDFLLCSKIRERFENKRTKIICEDALVLIPSLQVGSPFKVISNLPYNVGSPIIISLLTVCPTLPSDIIVMLQYEVARRICAKPGDSNRGMLTVLLELYGKSKIIENVSKDNFYPVPKVNSAVIHISEIKAPKIGGKSAIRILKMAFSGKRKKIKNSLFSTLKISSEEQQKIASACGFDLNQRPEDLNVDSWRKLIEHLVQTPAG